MFVLDKAVRRVSHDTLRVAFSVRLVFIAEKPAVAGKLKGEDNFSVQKLVAF